jgi:hypothetical protein
MNPITGIVSRYLDPEGYEARRRAVYEPGPTAFETYITDPAGNALIDFSDYMQELTTTPEERAARTALSSDGFDLRFSNPQGTGMGLAQEAAREMGGTVTDVLLNLNPYTRPVAFATDVGEAVGGARSYIENLVNEQLAAGTYQQTPEYQSALATFGDPETAREYLIDQATARTTGPTAAAQLADIFVPIGRGSLVSSMGKGAVRESGQEGVQSYTNNLAAQSIGLDVPIGRDVLGNVVFGAGVGSGSGAVANTATRAIDALTPGATQAGRGSDPRTFVPDSPTAGQPAQSTVDTAYEAQSPAFRDAVAATEFDPDAAFERLQSRFPGAQRAEGVESLAPSPAYEEQVPVFRSARAEAQRAQATADLQAAADIIDAGMNSVGGVEREATFRAIDEATGGRLNIDDVEAVLQDRMAARGATEAEGLFGQPRRADDFTSPFQPVQPVGIETAAPAAPVAPVVDTTSPFSAVPTATPPAADVRTPPAAPSNFDPDAAFERLQARFPGARPAEGIQTLAPAAPTAPAMDTTPPTAPAPSAPPPAAETRAAPSAPATPGSLAPSPWPLGPPPPAPPPNASAAEREAYRAEREERIRQVDAYMEGENAKEALRDNALTVLRGARTAQLSGDNQIISKSGAQALVDAGLLSPEDALVPVVANARARELLDLGPDGVYELMTSQPVEVEEQAAAPTTRPEVEETVEVEVEEQAAAPTTRPVPRPEVEETVEVEVEDRATTVPRTGTSTETATPRTVTGGTEVTPSEDAVAAVQVEDDVTVTPEDDVTVTPEDETEPEPEFEPEPEIELDMPEPPEEPPEEDIEVVVDEEPPEEEEEEVLEEEEEPPFECPPGFRRVQMANGGFTCVPEMVRPRVGPYTQTVDVSGLEGRTVFRPGTRRT